MTKKVPTTPKTSKLPSRPPVVAVLGHVDHGKTTLLDKIRQTKLAEKEPGLITQKIGAYQVEIPVGGEKKKITFLDTPGHEAFAKMRARGAQITDLAILVVAADDGVMPQTLESIKILKESQTPFVVVLNKTDLPTASPAKVKKKLAEAGVLVEELGGQVVCLPVSAKTGQGIKELLEMVLLLAEMEGISGDPYGPLKLAVVDSRLDPRKGPVATLIVQNGTLRQGDTVSLSGITSKVRGMFNENGKKISEVPPSTPVEILGLSEVPMVGEIVSEEVRKKEPTSHFRLILKTDTTGSLEAFLAILPSQIEIVAQGVGAISESDVLWAKTSGAIILGFNLRLSQAVAKLAETEGVVVKTYNIIYELLEEVKATITAPAASGPKEEILGQAQILAQFPYQKKKVAGCQVVAGRISLGDAVKVVRNSQEIGLSKIKSLRHSKENISKGEIGTECGILLSPPLDFQVGDVIMSYKFSGKSQGL